MINATAQLSFVEDFTTRDAYSEETYNSNGCRWDVEIDIRIDSGVEEMPWEQKNELLSKIFPNADSVFLEFNKGE